MNGFNNPWFFNNWKEGYPPKNVIDRIGALNPDVIRFPGGSLSFLFDINKPGYGAPSTALNYAPAHVRLVGDLGCKTSYVANLYPVMEDPSSEAYWIENIVNTMKILNPEYVELSNELYLYKHITGVETGDPRWWENRTKFITSVNSAASRYAELCNRTVMAIRHAGFNPKFGAIMDNAAHTRGRVWNTTVRMWDGYDFEVFHYYSTRKTSQEIYADLQRNFTGGTKPIAITEYWWDFGYDGKKNPQDVGKQYVADFEKNITDACSKDSRVFMKLRHQLYGTNVYSVLYPLN